MDLKCFMTVDDINDYIGTDPQSNTLYFSFDDNAKIRTNNVDGTDKMYEFYGKNEPLKFTNTGNEKGYINIIGSNLQHDVTFSFYNLDGSGEWVTYTFGPTAEQTGGRVHCNANDYILVKGDNEYISSSSTDYLMITGDKDHPCDFKIEGSIMSLLGDYVREISYNYCFYSLFAVGTSGNVFSSLDVTGLKLDAHKVMPYCYYNLFKNQTNLITPIFPPNEVWEKSMCVSYIANTGVQEYEIEFTASDLGQLQYFSADCANLTKAKITAHGATTRQEFAYMFRNCNSLTEVILDCEDFDGQDVCKSMFQDVTSTGILYVRSELVDNEVILAALPETWTIQPIE